MMYLNTSMLHALIITSISNQHVHVMVHVFAFCSQGEHQCLISDPSCLQTDITVY